MPDVFDAYATYYDLLNKDKNYSAEVVYLQELLNNFGMQTGTILELGCGTGKHAELLAQHGFSVHGIDVSPQMIQLAKQRSDATDIEYLLTFEIGDVRNIKVGKLFDAVISLFHVASYQTTNIDLESMFTTAASHLDEDGIFIFDFWYGPAVLTDLPSVRIKKIHDNNFKILRIAEPEIHPNHNIVDVNYTIQVSRSTGENDTLFEKHSMRYLFMPELERMLQNSGFKNINSYEWLKEKTLSFNSWQGIVTCQKS